MRPRTRRRRRSDPANQYDDPEGPKGKLRPISAGTAWKVAYRFPVLGVANGEENAPVSGAVVTLNVSSRDVGVFPPTVNCALSGDRPRASRPWITSEVESGSLVCWLSGALGS